MQLPLRNFTSLVQAMAAGVQGASAALLDLSVGSVLRAVLEASASVALWLQWLILLVLARTRAGTSAGADLDSWMADFALTRLPGVAASGSVTFGRYTAGYVAVIPAGTLVRTADGSQGFEVTAGGGGWSNAAGGYVVSMMATSLAVPVQAVVAGSAGNVQADAITQLATAIAGVDTVSNPAALTNGLDPETDAALRSRFVNYINSRSRATDAAIAYAVTSVQQGLRFSIAENQDASGAAHMGNFVVTVDDGTGSPPASLLTAVQGAVDAVRPVASTFAVLPPVLVPATIACTVTVGDPVQKAAIIPLVTTAVTDWVNALGMGQWLPISRVAQLAYDASPLVTNVTQLTLNGVSADLAVSLFGVVRVASVTVN